MDFTNVIIIFSVVVTTTYGMVTVPLEPVTTKPPSLADTCGVGCSDIIYTGSPWQDGSDPHLLVIQPSCYLNLPSQGVPSLGLDLQLEFSGDVFQITQWWLTETSYLGFTNVVPLSGEGDYKFTFQVFYNGTISYNPSYSYTTPPAGRCVYSPSALGTTMKTSPSPTVTIK